MKLGKATIGAIVVMAAAAPQAQAVRGAPLRNPNGVVIAWDKRAHANVVVTRDHRVYVIHALRRYRPGTRVRIRGIKWGRLGLGIKWGFRPRGIKWGIRVARNGTYVAGLRPVGRTKLMSLRGTVIRRYRRGVAVSVRGAVLTFPYARGAVWLPRTTLNAGTVGGVGSRVLFKLTVTSTGTTVMSTAKELVPATPGATVPYAGTIVSVSPDTGTVVVDAGSDPAFPLVLTLTVPVTVDLTKYKRGDRIAGAVVTSRTGGDDLVATNISKNDSFTAADNPATTVDAPAPDATNTAMIDSLRSAWHAGAAAGKFGATGTGLHESGAEQLDITERAIIRSDNARALDAITRFIVRVQTANHPTGSPQAIDPQFQADILAVAEALQARIARAMSPTGSWPGPSPTGTGGTGGTGGTTGTGSGNGQGNGNGHTNQSSGGSPQSGGTANAQGGGTKTTGSGSSNGGGTQGQATGTGPDDSSTSDDAGADPATDDAHTQQCVALTNPGAAQRSPVATVVLIAHCLEKTTSDS